LYTCGVASIAGDRYPVVWFYTHSESIKDAIEAARGKLTPAEQKRIGVVVEPSIISRPGREK
jgi:hypothetical protein